MQRADEDYIKAQKVIAILKKQGILTGNQVSQEKYLQLWDGVFEIIDLLEEK